MQTQFVSTHPIGHGLHLHQVAPQQQGGRLPPLEVTDGHGRRQKVQEVILDGSGIQEIPMPADGNVIFIVEEGVTLDVKDPETGEYIPLEEWYRRLAERTPPKPQDRYIVVNGDASNIIVEDADGQIIHRCGCFCVWLLGKRLIGCFPGVNASRASTSIDTKWNARIRTLRAHIRERDRRIRIRSITVTNM
ncbi:hypothetical protein M407DRAFT_165995 [Tulasnella calospora MUT 4182]|uniref:Uncharacterized protein n=1 Tax=Tulasnella calospora MUT 4182 TaxID=1051891 RepID=A0A0C3MJS1_9AGAM|nr:hypothetical protein M407DRAFT_165995 [Tulasnella calospora MUT 4182]